MKLITKIGTVILFVMHMSAHAGSPLWTFTPLTATTISLSSSSTATVQYLVTNQSSKSHTLMLQPMGAVAQVAAGVGICPSPFTLAGKSSCVLSLQITGSQLTKPISDGPIICSANSKMQCYRPSSANILNVSISSAGSYTTLTSSVATLTLSVNDTGFSPYLTGNPRTIVITNLGSVAATNVTYSASALPAGTTINPASCGTIQPAASCAITITPGNVPSAAAYDTSPVPITLNVAGDNTNTLSPTINIVTYGSVYQGGFVYAVDDSTSNITSIGGKVVSLVDQAQPYITSGPQASSIIWSSNGNGVTSSDVSSDIIPLISEITSGSDSYANALSNFNSTYSNTSTYPFPSLSAFSTCSGAVDGACNSANIFALYDMYRTNFGVSNILQPGPTNFTFYATGLCNATIDGYSDWYLPSICEMDAVNSGVSCPAMQSMQGSLTVLMGDPNAITPSTSCSPPAGTNCLAGLYWSSTQFSSAPQFFAWTQYFDTSSSVQGPFNKDTILGVRCSRLMA